MTFPDTRGSRQTHYGRRVTTWRTEPFYDDGMTSTGKTRLQCPCGEFFEGADEDDLVEQAQRHLQERHPHLQYDREDILFMAY